MKEELAKVIPNVTGLIEEAKRSKLSRDAYLSYAIETVAQNLSAVFHASVDAIKRRISFDKLYGMIP